MIAALITRRRREDQRGDDIPSLLLGARDEDGTPMTDDELHDQLMTLLVAGHETTASSLAFTIEQLVRHPAVLHRLRAEMTAGEDDAYLTATIHESLRRRPVLPNAAPRLTVAPYEVGGRAYPAGVCLVPAAYLLHHDPSVYPDPFAFEPERFVDSAPGTYTWIPFGGGRRRCIGASFAMLESKLVLRALLDRFDVQPVGASERPRRRDITITPGRGCTVRLHRRSAAPRRPGAVAVAVAA